MAEVVKISDHLEEVGDTYRMDPEELLENAKGMDFANLLILGQLPDGEIYASGSSNVGMALVLMELAKHQMIHED